MIGFVFGIALNKGFEYDVLSMIFAGIYAIISTVTASICIGVTAYGNVSALLLWAMLGSLVLPSLFGVVTQPNINAVTIYKVFGFFMALICVILNFIAAKNKKKDNLKIQVTLRCCIFYKWFGTYNFQYKEPSMFKYF